MRRILLSSLLIKILGSSLAVFMFFLIARTLPIDAFGNFSAGFAVAQALAAISSLGLGTAVLRETSASLGAQDKASADARAHAFTRLMFYSSAVALALPALAMPFGYGVIQCASIAALAALIGWSEYISCLMRGYGEITSALAPREILWRLGVVLVALVMLWMQVAPQEGTAWLMIAAGLLAVVVLGQWLLFVRRPRRLWKRKDQYGLDFRRFMAGNWELWVIASLSVFEAHISVVLVRIFLDAESTAILFLAMKLTSVIALPIVAAGPAVAPQIAAAFAQGNKRRVQHVGAATALVSTLGGLVGLGMILIGGEWIFAFLDTGYDGAIDVLLILAGFQLVSALLGPTGFAMLMMGYQRVALKALLLAVAVSVGGIASLSQFLGVYGAAFGIGGLILINKSICYIFLWQNEQVHMSVLGLWGEWKARKP